MISLKNCSNRLYLLLLMGLLAGCATAKPLPLKLASVAPESEWRIAVFPVENLSGVPLPLAEIRQELMAEMSGAGLHPIEQKEVDRFIEQHWVRYTGGVDEATSQSIRQETGADAVLVTSVEYYIEGEIPKISLITRLVVTGKEPTIFWMDSMGLSGDDNPGLLGLGLITDMGALRRKGFGMISASLERYLSDPSARQPAPFGLLEHHKPRLLHNEFTLPGEGKPSIAVVPIVNQSLRKNGGEILLLHLVKNLFKSGRFKVLEPGVIRDNMLRRRTVMKEGISLLDVHHLSIALDVELMLSGVLFKYEDSLGALPNPKVDFSVQMIERQDRKVLFSSRSYNNGSDGVYFYDWGRINTASSLADRMIDSLVRRMTVR